MYDYRIQYSAAEIMRSSTRHMYLKMGGSTLTISKGITIYTCQFTIYPYLYPQSDNG